MRFRTKIFLGWVVLTLVLWGGTYFAIRRSVEQSFNRMSGAAFAGVNRGLRNLYVERVSSMRQACQLVVNIPELRALIAEQNYELTPENQVSLGERLDYVNGVVGSTFVFALSEQGLAVAQSRGGPWETTAQLDRFLKASPAAWSLVESTFTARESGQYGFWEYDGRLYQVAAVPLVFQNDRAFPEGALVMGKRLDDTLAGELGKSYGCEISFLTAERVAASSLPAALQDELLATYGGLVDDLPKMLELGDATYRAASEPLLDTSSGEEVGTVLIQQDQANADAFLWEVLRSLVITIIIGLAAAALASFVLSLAVTQPVQTLVAGVRRVAAGDLDVEFHIPGRDEMAQLGAAFDDMVGRLRESRSEQDRLLAEARSGQKREQLLHEMAQQINQRLDVQSSLTMFLNSVQNLFPDVEMAVFRFDAETQELHLLKPYEPNGTSDVEVAEPPQPPHFDHSAVIDRLARHELVYVPRSPQNANLETDSSGRQASVCLLPMQSEKRLLGVITATRAGVDAFDDEDRDFLKALADHFAIALANAQMYEELRRAYQELRDNQRQTIQSERLRALGQMASGIAHDFNNHLTGVLAFLEMSLDHENLDDEVRSWLEMSRESSLAAAEVVKLLRNFYRRDNSESLESLELNKLVTGTISLTRPRWFDMPRQHGLVVDVVEDCEAVGHVMGNASELRDALTNLLFNAIDAMPEGGTITVRTRAAGDRILLEVEDTGTGMTDEVRKLCLDPFYTTKGQQGTGLGLSMVHGIVERNGGHLAIDSEWGRGTTVRLSFAKSTAEGAPAELPFEHDDQRPKQILCVDDDVRILKSLEGMLRQLGHEVMTTSSGADAIQQVAGGHFDLLITDLGMPNVDGREVARSAKQSAPRTKVILFTGWADRLAIEHDLPEGVDQILGKPITKQRLQQALQGC